MKVDQTSKWINSRGVVDSLEDSKNSNCLELPSWQDTQIPYLFMESVIGKENLETTRCTMFAKGCP